VIGVRTDGRQVRKSLPITFGSARSGTWQHRSHERASGRNPGFCEWDDESGRPFRGRTARSFVEESLLYRRFFRDDLQLLVTNEQAMTAYQEFAAIVEQVEREI
jgi:hypothetical protein